MTLAAPLCRLDSRRLSVSVTHLVSAVSRAFRRPPHTLPAKARDQRTVCTSAPPIQTRWFVGSVTRSASRPFAAGAGSRTNSARHCSPSRAADGCQSNHLDGSRPHSGSPPAPCKSSKEHRFVEILPTHHVPGGLGQFARQRLHRDRHIAAALLALIPGTDLRIEAYREDRRLSEGPR